MREFRMRLRSGRVLFQCCCLFFALAIAGEESRAEFKLRDGETILFLGDSNTFADHQVQYFEAFLFTRFPNAKFRVINRGMPSETAAGTSEPTHVPPRPNVHDRLGDVLREVQPQWVIASYGMNDGIYLPPNAEVFAKYRAGIQRLIDRTRESGARLVLVTPPPFDVRPFAGKAATNPPDYRRPASNYDDVLKQFAEWLASIPGQTVVDIHAPLSEVLERRRSLDERFKFSGDGIHLDRTGHMIWALELLNALQAPAEIVRWEIDAKAADGTKLAPLPMPHDKSWDAESLRLAGFDERLNLLPLIFTNGTAARLTATLTLDGSSLRATVEIPEGTREFDLYPAYARLTAGRCAEVLRMVQERRRAMLELWVKNETHPRLAGMHRDSTATLEAVTRLEERIRAEARPLSLRLKLVRPK